MLLAVASILSALPAWQLLPFKVNPSREAEMMTGFGQSPYRYVIERQSNVLRVDFNREPDPPGPSFSGAGALRDAELDIQLDAVALAANH